MINHSKTKVDRNKVQSNKILKTYLFFFFAIFVLSSTSATVYSYEFQTVFSKVYTNKMKQYTKCKEAEKTKYLVSAACYWSVEFGP